MTGEITSSALLLFLVIFVWTPPHFWALAIARKDEYAKVGIPMLPVTHGEAYTRMSILLYTILLVVITVIPYLTGMSGLIYLLTALVFGGVFLNYAIRMKLDSSDETLPMRTFRFFDYLPRGTVCGAPGRSLFSDPAQYLGLCRQDVRLPQ